MGWGHTHTQRSHVSCDGTYMMCTAPSRPALSRKRLSRVKATLSKETHTRRQRGDKEAGRRTRAQGVGRTRKVRWQRPATRSPGVTVAVRVPVAYAGPQHPPCHWGRVRRGEGSPDAVLALDGPHSHRAIGTARRQQHRAILGRRGNRGRRHAQNAAVVAWEGRQRGGARDGRPCGAVNSLAA